MSCFSSFTEEQKHLSQVIEILRVLETKSAARVDVPLSSSRTTWSTSTTSCCVLKLKGALRIDDILRCNAQRKFDGSTALLLRFLTAMFKEIDFSSGDRVVDSDGTWFQSSGKTLRTWRITFA